MMKKVLFLLGVVVSCFTCFNSLNEGLVFADSVNSANLNENSFQSLMNEIVVKNDLSVERSEKSGLKRDAGENKKESVELEYSFKKEEQEAGLLYILIPQ